LWDFIFFFLVELGTCLQNLIPRIVEHWEKNYFAQEGIMKSTYIDNFLTIKKAYKNVLCQKSKRWTHTLVPLLCIEFFIFLKSSKSMVFQKSSSLLSLDRFREILVVLCRFGQILLHWQWVRVCPKQGWNLKNPLTH
jgi:hypothetical protein